MREGREREREREGEVERRGMYIRRGGVGVGNCLIFVYMSVEWCPAEDRAGDWLILLLSLLQASLALTNDPPPTLMTHPLP